MGCRALIPENRKGRKRHLQNQLVGGQQSTADGTDPQRTGSPRHDVRIHAPLRCQYIWVHACTKAPILPSHIVRSSFSMFRIRDSTVTNWFQIDFAGPLTVGDFI